MRRLTPSHARMLAAREEPPPDVLAGRFARLEAVRDWLLPAVGGCPLTRDLLLDLVSGRLTQAEVAAAAGWSASKVSRTIGAALTHVRWAARLAAAADRRFQSEPGFTLHPDTGEAVGPLPLWGVSLADHGVRLSARPTRDDLMRFLAARAGVLRLRRGRRRYFGGWVEQPAGAYWLDVTVLLPDREAALAFARKNRQRAITHLATGEEVSLAAPARRRAA